MTFTSDIPLRSDLWIEAENTLLKNNLFERLVDLFIVACSIGIKEDKIIIGEGEARKQIPRVTYLQHNDDLCRIVHFLYQNAILNTKTVDYSDEVRLRLAFDPDYQPKSDKITFSPVNFIANFANYGLSKILDIYTDQPLIFASELNKLLNTLITDNEDDIIAEINEDIINFEL